MLSLIAALPLLLKNVEKLCKISQNLCIVLNLKNFNSAKIHPYLISMHVSQIVWLSFPLVFYAKQKLIQRRKTDCLEILANSTLAVSILSTFASALDVYLNDYFSEMVDLKIFRVSAGVIHSAVTLVFMQLSIAAYALETTLIKLMRTTPLSDLKKN